MTEALAALPPLASSDESGSDDEATVPDRAAPSLHERLVAAEQYNQAREAEAARREPPRREPPRYEAEELREWREEAVRRERTRARARDQERRERETVPTIGGSWVCAACTFENPNPNALVCEICNTISLAQEEAFPRRLMAEDAAALESARAATAPRPPAPRRARRLHPRPAVAGPPPRAAGRCCDFPPPGTDGPPAAA